MSTRLMITFLIGLFTISACTTDEDVVSDNGLIGKWKLVEILVDPGDGSGTFQSTEKERTLIFMQNSTVESDFSFCSMFDDEVNYSLATYSLKDSTITSNACDYKLSFDLKGNELTLHYLCFEACAEKYVMVNE